MLYPEHSISEFIAERVNPKVFDERGSPTLSRGPGTWPLPQQSKDDCRGLPFCPRLKQAEVAHGVPVAVEDMLR